eukprot:Selendium_serpulae@DN5701_c0_g2_i7.p1
MSKLFRFDRHLVHRVYIRYEKHAESNQRNTPVAELITGKVVFPGKDELGMLRLFCKFTGTPKKDEVAFLQQLGESDIRSLQNPGKHPLDGPLKLFEVAGGVKLTLLVLISVTGTRSKWHGLAQANVDVCTT